MSGRTVFTPDRVHECAPGWRSEWREADARGLFAAGWYSFPPLAAGYPAGTAWECECGRTWVSTGPVAPNSPGVIGFRPERRLERRRRERRSGLRGSPS